MDLTPKEMAVAEWTYAHGEPAGAGTQTLPSVKLFFIPMKTLEETIGVIGIQFDFKNLLLDQRRLPGRHLQSLSPCCGKMGQDMDMT